MITFLVTISNMQLASKQEAKELHSVKTTSSFDRRRLSNPSKIRYGDCRDNPNSSGSIKALKRKKDLIFQPWHWGNGAYKFTFAIDLGIYNQSVSVVLDEHESFKLKKMALEGNRHWSWYVSHEELRGGNCDTVAIDTIARQLLKHLLFTEPDWERTQANWEGGEAIKLELPLWIEFKLLENSTPHVF